MDGLSRAVGAPTPVTLPDGEGGQRTYLLRPLCLSDIGAVEQHLLANRHSPITLAKANLDGLVGEDRRYFLADALRLEHETTKNHITPAEFESFCDSRPGAAMTLWLMLRAEQPLTTLEHVTRIIDGMTTAEFQRALDLRDQASASDDLGFGIGQAAPASALATAEPTEKSTTPASDLTGGC